MISAFDLFKIGIGPSSSHTVGPMIAARRFRGCLRNGVALVTAELFGSLAWTGRGHGTHQAISLGLLGQVPATIEPDCVDTLVAQLQSTRKIHLDDGTAIRFDPAVNLLVNLHELLPGHSNGMRFRAFAADGAQVLEQVYYSIGGGFVLMEGELAPDGQRDAPFPFETAEELLDVCGSTGRSIADVQRANEETLRSPAEVDAGLDAIRDAMFRCIDRGLSTEGMLPGRLNVKRRARELHEKIRSSAGVQRAHGIMDWVSAYAMAVNEENAAGGRIVTAPTNGAAGVIPAVLRYLADFCKDSPADSSRVFLLTAAAIGSLIKRNASISGAEAGCQGEVGSAAAMAAAGLAAALGATPAQVENAAEIAMEYHLGMTCDPVGGLVQIPCIERNAIGANKSIAAASLAMRGDGTHRVSLDQVIETMRQTGADMQSKYKETSQGGLAVNVAEC